MLGVGLGFVKVNKSFQVNNRVSRLCFQLHHHRYSHYSFNFSGLLLCHKTYQIKLNRELVEAVGNAYKFGGVKRNPNTKRVEELLKKGADPEFPDLHAQPDFVMPWLPDNKRRR